MTDSAYGTFAIGGDLTVDRVGFGAMRLARNGMGDTDTRDPETARAVLRRAVELGVNHIDTADFYRNPHGNVLANDLIREALSPYPEGLVIATKVGPVFGPQGPTQGPAGDLRAAVEANLEALGVDRLELVYLRIGWRKPPRGESLSERLELLAALREEGLIRHLALRNVDLTHLAEAERIAPVVAIQNLFDPSNPDEVALAERALMKASRSSRSDLWAADAAGLATRATPRSRSAITRPPPRSRSRTSSHCSPTPSPSVGLGRWRIWRRTSRRAH